VSGPDVINGLFELCSGIFVWSNVVMIRRHKSLRGVHWIPTIFFTLWGYWNLYYYPSLDQWFSFFGGISIVTSNSVWLYYVYKYRKV